MFIESEDDAGVSDYSQTKRERDRKRAQRISKGHPASDTEFEDDEDDLQLQDEVEEEEDVAPQSTQPRRQKAKSFNIPAIDKGKGKATSTPGPLPDAAKEEAQEFGRQVMDAADVLADRWNTSRRSILVAASLMLRESRAPNSANKHSEWYASTFPKQEGGKHT